jgi:uncharacterized protein YjbI with pentapeptide repeats
MAYLAGETLLTPSSIKLFGRVMQGIKYDYANAGIGGTGLGANKFLQKQLEHDVNKGSDPPTFARIYAFSFEGAFYQLARPAIFLVHGPGVSVGNWGNPSTMDWAGVAAREWDFSGNGKSNDMVYWEYEKGDFSLRLDLDAGPFEQILLQGALRAGAGVSGAGVSGAGVSGAGVSGAGVSGAGVSGAGVSGAGVSGAGVSGAGVSGAGVRR